MIGAALGIDWQTTSRTKKLTLNLVFCRSVKLSEKEDFTWSATRCVFRIDLPHHSGQCCKTLASYSLLRRGQGRRLTLAKDLLNDLNAIDCYINDVINFNFSQFNRLVDSFNSIFYCWRTSKYIFIFITGWHRQLYITELWNKLYTYIDIYWLQIYIKCICMT